MPVVKTTSPSIPLAGAEGPAFEFGAVLEQEARPLSPGHWKLLGLRCPVWPAEARRRRTPRHGPQALAQGDSPLART